MHQLVFVGSTVLAILLGAAVCHLLSRLGAAGRSVAATFCRAPGLDLVITYFTIAPMIVGLCMFGPSGLVEGIAGQVIGMQIWEWLHELANRDVMRGPRIVKVINGKLGYWRNAAATWTTAFATPIFWFVRIAELCVYPPLTWLAGLPKYESGDWVNVSRQKFEGLVGHDLIWCLYCDWMTGVWSLGTEMLRNVESFWCPIRFLSYKKCENCKIDFPDIANGWVDARGTMADVTRVLAEKYPAPDGSNAWMGHPVRLTVKGEVLSDQLSSDTTGGNAG